ncbi:vesicle transport v-snare protein vti1 [Coniophora puteana RWD-64-598 SS2]|uniref:Vesicle transport v-snare protein vti1 n=1 Tax=Coniophora puteana (strain RWD-64-598) TaxID=741705 RepID=A0A5M3MTB0_CONPW|nr:vesicle transport v-snare protein vti1 [Coniophora puteana RWD-64-598 SS2]EIW82409.1 vesicle transport v-snare protein vti1 [Coniophora puteana RWD-64-598 SS2]
MDSSPTSLFDSYEQEFHQLIDAVRTKLDGDAKNEQGGSVPEQRKAALRRVEMELDEADEMVSQMEIEIQGIPQSIKAQYQARLRTTKSELSRYKKLSKDLHSHFNRTDLLASSGSRVGSPISDDPYGNASDRSRLLSGTTVLEDGTRRLQESQRIALETEGQGAEILMNLRQQREQIENARDTLHTADNAIDRASGTLKKMIRRMYQQRVVTAAIIIVLVLLICIIIWEKLLR